MAAPHQNRLPPHWRLALDPRAPPWDSSRSCWGEIPTWHPGLDHGGPPHSTPRTLRILSPIPPLCPGVRMDPHPGAASSAGTWWRSCSAWGWTRWWPEGRSPTPGQGSEGPRAARSDAAEEETPRLRVRHILFLTHPWENGDRTSFSSWCCPKSVSAPGSSMGGFALAARTEPGTAPHGWGVQGLADPVPAGEYGPFTGASFWQ